MSRHYHMGIMRSSKRSLWCVHVRLLRIREDLAWQRRQRTVEPPWYRPEEPEKLEIGALISFPENDDGVAEIERGSKVADISSDPSEDAQLRRRRDAFEMG